MHSLGNMFYRQWNIPWIVYVIVGLSLFLRLYQLGTYPVGFHNDELDAGYVGRYILIHKEDIFGNPFPLFFDRFGDYRPTLIFYLSGLSTIVFGMTEFAVRFPAALLGGLTVVPLYLFVQRVSKQSFIAVGSSFALAVLPWHIVLSRATSEGIIGLFFLTCALSLLVKHETYKLKQYLFIGMCFVLTFWSYHLYRLLIPFVVLPFIISWNDKKILWWRGSFIAISIILTLLLSTTSWGRGRFSQVAFYNNPGASDSISIFESTDGSEGVAFIVTRMFHNKVVMYVREFLSQYLGYFSPGYLLLHGGLPDRYVVPETGLIPLWMIPFGFISLFVFSRGKKEFIVFGGIIIYFLLVAPLPAALTNEDSPNMHRSMLMIIPFSVMIGTGIGFIYSVLLRLKNNRIIWIVGTVYICIICIEGYYISHQYFIHSAVHKAVYRQQGNRELIDTLKTFSRDRKVFITSKYDLPYYALFYYEEFSKDIIHDVIMNNKISIYNMTFYPVSCVTDQQTSDWSGINPLVVDDGECKNGSEQNSQKFKTEKIISRKDGTSAFKIFTVVQ